MAVETRSNPKKQVFTLNLVSGSFAIMFVCFFVFVCGVTLWGVPASPTQTQKWVDQLPEGEGKDIVATDCLLCHTLERVVASHRSRGEWDKLVNQMIERGAPLGDDQVSMVVNYLAKNFGPGQTNPVTTKSSSSIQAGAPSADAPKKLIIDPDQAQFNAVPDSLGLPKDIQIFIITGDPTRAGPYSVLLKIPVNVVIPAHWESTEENIVVLRGTFEFGEGDNFDAGKLQALKPQTVLLIPGRMHNFSLAKDATIIMLSGVGPISFGHDKSN